MLFVAPDFAPSSYPPALRARIFTQYLSDFGWDPLVLTIDPSFYEWETDLENERMLRPDLEIIRTRALDARWTRLFGVGDLGLRTFWHLWRAIDSAARNRRIDLLFISVAPFYAALLGRLAFERFGIPYVIDYQDPWVSDHWKRAEPAGRFTWRYLKRAASHALATTLEPLALRHVSHLTAVSSGTTDPITGRYRWLGQDDATEIPFGGDASDFEYLRTADRDNVAFDPHDGNVHLSYVGAIADDMRPALKAILLAVRTGAQRAPDVFARLRMHFVGTTYAADGEGRETVLPVARELGIDHLVDEQPGRVPYLDALKLLVDSHGLIVVGSQATHYTASKIFPYILAERPLLALFHERSTVVRILRETAAGDAVTFDSEAGPLDRVIELTERLTEMLVDPAGQTPHYARDAFEAYSSRAMTGRLASVFDRVVGQEPVSDSAVDPLMEVAA